MTTDNHEVDEYLVFYGDDEEPVLRGRVESKMDWAILMEIEKLLDPRKGYESAKQPPMMFGDRAKIIIGGRPTMYKYNGDEWVKVEVE